MADGWKCSGSDGDLDGSRGPARCQGDERSRPAEPGARYRVVESRAVGSQR